MRSKTNTAFGFTEAADAQDALAVPREKVNLFQFTDIHDIPTQWERKGFGPLSATFTFINHSPVTQNNGEHFKVSYTKEQLEEARLEIDGLMGELGTEIEELTEAKVKLVSKNLDGARDMIASRSLKGFSELLEGVLNSMKIRNWTGFYVDQQKELEVAKNVIDRVLEIPDSNFTYENHQPFAA